MHATESYNNTQLAMQQPAQGAAGRQQVARVTFISSRMGAGACCGAASPDAGPSLLPSSSGACT